MEITVILKNIEISEQSYSRLIAWSFADTFILNKIIIQYCYLNFIQSYFSGEVLIAVKVVALNKNKVVVSYKHFVQNTGAHNA